MKGKEMIVGKRRDERMDKAGLGCLSVAVSLVASHATYTP